LDGCWHLVLINVLVAGGHSYGLRGSFSVFHKHSLSFPKPAVILFPSGKEEGKEEEEEI